MKTLLYVLSALCWVALLLACSENEQDVTITGIEVTRYSPIDAQGQSWDSTTGPDLYVVIDSDGGGPTTLSYVVSDVQGTPIWAPLITPYTLNRPTGFPVFRLMDQDDGGDQVVGTNNLDAKDELASRPGSLELKDGTTAIRLYLEYD